MDEITKLTDVLVIGEINNSEIDKTTLEVLGVSNILRSKGIKRVGTLIGGNSVKDGELKKVIHYGSDYVIFIKNAVFSEFAYHVTAKIFIDYIKMINPIIILSAATVHGTTLMPYIAAKLNTGLTADCTSLDIDPIDGKLLQIRPAIGGNIMATIKTMTIPQMATVRPNTYRPTYINNRDGQIIVKQDESKYNSGFLLSEIETRKRHQNLVDANIICSGGRGLKNIKNFALVSKLAEKIGGVVGASRVAVEQGWASYPHQVGLSGKTVSPKLYLALGISGAIQHLAGIQTSQYIIAVNRDPEAQIFRVSDLGIVGDVTEVVTKIIELLEKRGQNASF
jgi:electron transfer flavoprotein alpha subunit